jgi:Kef-type K+ transport system membrane component KefB
MSSFLQLIFSLLVIILFAKIASLISIKLGQPSVLGELLVGILLGPTMLDLTHLPFLTNTHLTETVIEFGELGVLLLMLIAGLELHLSELSKNVRVSAYAGALGVLFPVALGWGTGAMFGFDTPSALFLGLILGATSVSISAQTLIELKVLRTRVGLGLLGAAVFDDILVILLLSTVLAIFTGGGGLVSILLIFLRILLYLGASVALGIWGLPWLTRQVSRLQISQATLSLALVVLFLYSLTAEVVGGMAAITGAFLAGLMFARTPEKERIERGVRSLAYGLFVPIFFVSIGLEINLRDTSSGALILLLVIVIIGVLGKMLGSGLGALLGGFTQQESLQLGAGMVSRGEVGLIVAAIGLQEGYVQAEEFSAVIGMVIITTLITPPLLRSLFARKHNSPDADPQSSGEVTVKESALTEAAPTEAAPKEVKDVHDHAHS